MEKLASAEQKFAEQLPPVEALRAWLLLFVDYIAAKHLIAPALNALVGDPKKVFEASYAQVWEASRALVKRAIKSGDIRKDLDPVDLLRALIGVANVATSEAEAGDIALAGLPGASSVVDDTPTTPVALAVRPTVSVVVCGFTEDRWDDLCRAVSSLHRQTEPAQEIAPTGGRSSQLNTNMVHVPASVLITKRPIGPPPNPLTSAY